MYLEHTQNRAVYVQNTATTLNKLAAMGKKVVGADGWKESVVFVDEIIEQSWAELRKEKPNPDYFVLNFLGASIWGEGYGSHFEKLDNESLGLEQMGDTEVQILVNSLAK